PGPAARRGRGAPAGDPAFGPFDESRARAPIVSPAAPGCPVGFDTPVVLSGAFGVADMSRTVARVGAPVAASDACLLLSPQATGRASRTIGMSATRRAR